MSLIKGELGERHIGYDYLAQATSGEMSGPCAGGILTLDGDPLDWPVEDRPWIYVAGYYAACPSQGTANAAHWAANLTDVGWNALVPHFSLLYDMFMPMPASYWYAYDIGILARMDAIFVCPGTLTDESSGVAKEVAFAVKHDIPVFHEVVAAKDRYRV